MIYGRGKWLYGALVLVARDAARHFAFVRGKSPRGGSGSWRPLALRWRRRRKHRENVSTTQAATGPRVFWFPQFHFHYATQRNDRTRRDRVIALAPGPEVSETRVVVDRHWTSVRSGVITALASRADRTLHQFHSPQSSGATRDAALINTPRSLRTSGRSIQALQASGMYRGLRPFDSSQSLRHRSDASVTNTPRSLRTSGHPMVVPAGSRPRRLQFGTILERVRAGKPREERIPFVNHSQIWHHWLQSFGRRPTAPRDLFSSGRKENKPLPVQFDRPEEIVWRRAGRPSTEVADPERRQEFSNSYEEPALRSFLSQEAARVPANFEQPAVQQITTLDPSVLDRLTDDVIRRVEQRARIERERRGL